MRKKFFSAMLFMALAVPTAGVFVSCSDYDDDINSLKDDVTSLKTQLETTKTDLENELTTVKGDYAAQIEAAVAGKADQSAVDDLNAQLLAAESKLQTQIDAINDALEGVDAGKISEALATLAAVTGDVDKLDDRVSAVEANLDIQKKALDKFLESIQNAGFENADELIKAITGAQSAISELQGKVSDNADDITTLKSLMAEAENSLATLNSTVNGLQGQIDALTVFVDKLLSGLVFAPDFYYGGIEAMEATTINYTPVVLANNSTLANPLKDGETWKPGTATSLTPDVVAKYHMNPSYFDVSKIKSMNVISDDKEYLQLGGTRAAASAPSVVKDSWLNSKDGMLNVTLNLDASKIADDESHVTVLAVQACFNGKDGKDSTVTSDYAAVAKSTIKNVVIADPEADATGTTCTLKNFHIYTTASEAITADPTHEIVYNDAEGVDLTKLVQAHFLRNTSITEQSMDDVAKYGMKWEFAESHYTAGSNKTSESAHIYIKDNHAIACTVDAQGNPQEGVQDRSSIGRLPMVRVTLVDTTKTENNIVAVGFIKFKISEEAAKPVEDEDVTFTGSGYDLSCTDYTQTLTWAQIEAKVLSNLNMSKEEFEDNYSVEMNGNTCQLYALVDGKPQKSTQYGEVVEKVDDQAHETSTLSWTVTDAEMYKAVWDATKQAYKTGVTLTTGVRFVNKNNTTGGVHSNPDLYVWFTTGTITTPTASLPESSKINKYWAATNGALGSGYAEIHNNVEVVGQQGADDEFVNDILNTFTGNKITLNITGSSAFGDANLTKSFKFVITDATKTQTGLSGEKYTLTTDGTGTTLYANHNGSRQAVAVLNGSIVTYQKTNYALDLLNAASHSDLANTFTASVGINAFNGCDMVLPITGSEFNMKFLRPIDVTGKSAEFTDAIDNGNVKDLADLVSFQDWRGQWQESYIGYYGVTAITADIDNITTTMNNGKLGETKLSEVTSQLKFTQEGVGTDGTYGGVSFGHLLYENNGQVTGTFQVRVPLTVTYDWGTVKTYVDITINQTKANAPARR